MLRNILARQRLIRDAGAQTGCLPVDLQVFQFAHKIHQESAIFITQHIDLVGVTPGNLHANEFLKIFQAPHAGVPPMLRLPEDIFIF